MEISNESLRRYYSSLPDEALLALDPSELTEMARVCYDAELGRRNLKPRPDRGRPVWTGDAGTADDFPAPEFTTESGWGEDAVCVCAFEARHGIGQSSDAERARDVLEAAHIPCQISVEQLENPHAPQYEYRVIVPTALSLKATSVLDIEIFNPRLEAEWRTHFEQLSADELRAVNAESLCAGLLDRAARLKRAYVDELARRRLR